jgi:hypothetical protein
MNEERFYKKGVISDSDDMACHYSTCFPAYCQNKITDTLFKHIKH